LIQRHPQIAVLGLPGAASAPYLPMLRLGEQAMVVTSTNFFPALFP
jgi:hypothetical protein